MKHLLFALVLLPWLAVADEYPNYKIDLDWEKPGTLEDNVVQMCDDTYYPKVEIKIPGKAGKDFQVEMDVDITSGKLSPGCTVSKKEGRGSVTYTLDAESYCTVKVYQTKPKPGEKRKVATYDISDAC